MTNYQRFQFMLEYGFRQAAKEMTIESEHGSNMDLLQTIDSKGLGNLSKAAKFMTSLEEVKDALENLDIPANMK